MDTKIVVEYHYMELDFFLYGYREDEVLQNIGMFRKDNCIVFVLEIGGNLEFLPYCPNSDKQVTPLGLLHSKMLDMGIAINIVYRDKKEKNIKVQRKLMCEIFAREFLAMRLEILSNSVDTQYSEIRWYKEYAGEKN